MTLADAPPTDASLQLKMEQLLATAEEQFLAGNHESGGKYISTGVGLAAILGSQSNARQLAVTLLKQYALGLPKTTRDELVSTMDEGQFESNWTKLN